MTAVEQKVTANTTALEGKQAAGNYLPYKTVDKNNNYSVQDSATFSFKNLKGFEYSEAGINGLGFHVNDMKR